MSVKVTSGKVFCNNVAKLTTVVNGVTTVTHSSSLLDFDVSSTRTGHENPRHKYQIQRHINAGTVLTGSRTTARMYQGTYHQAYVTTVSPFQRTVRDVTEAPTIGAPSTSLPSSASALGGATAGYYKKARNAQRSFQSGTFFGELAETIRMIKHPARAFRESVSQFTSTASRRMKDASRRGSSKQKTKNSGKALADTYLEYAFGWRPLIGDIKAGAKALAKIQEKAVNNTVRVSSKGHSETAGTPTFLNIAIQTTILGTSFRVTRGSADAIIYGAVKIADNPELDGRIQRQIGFTLSDVVPTVWELVPWSFLIDYFTNLGDVISAACFPRSDLVWTMQCIKRRNSSSNVVQHRKNPNAGGINTRIIADYGSPGSIIRTFEDISRSQSGSLPLPPFQLQIPGSNVQFMNIGALVASKRSRPRF